MVAHPMAKQGTIQCIEGKDVHPNQNIPTGIKIDSMHTKYKRPSGVLDILPRRRTYFSCQILRNVAIMPPMQIAGGKF